MGDELRPAYTGQTALLSHHMIHNHSSEVGEVATIRLQTAQSARNTCSRWILHQTDMPTNTNIRIWNHLQLLLPSPHHAILTNHTCQEEGPLAVLCRDLHHHLKGTIDTIDLVGTSITVVYVTLSQMRVIRRSGAHHTPLLKLPKRPQYRLFHQYPERTAQAAENRLLHNASMKTAYRNVQGATPISRLGDGTLQTHRLTAQTRPPGDGPGPTDSPTTGSRRGKAHADHRHPLRARVAHTKTPHDNPGPTDGPQQLPRNGPQMLGL